MNCLDNLVDVIPSHHVCIFEWFCTCQGSLRESPAKNTSLRMSPVSLCFSLPFRALIPSAFLTLCLPAFLFSLLCFCIGLPCLALRACVRACVLACSWSIVSFPFIQLRIRVSTTPHWTDLASQGSDPLMALADGNWGDHEAPNWFYSFLSGFDNNMAVGQNQWYHFGIGAPPIVVYFSGDWDVHWGYGVLTHGHMATRPHSNTPLVCLARAGHVPFVWSH